MNKEYSLTELNCCLPDYFQGSAKQCIAVPVYKEMTKEELTEAIVRDYFESDYNEWPEFSKEELQQLCDDFILTETPFMDTCVPWLPIDEEDEGDSVYLYIGLTEE